MKLWMLYIVQTDDCTYSYDETLGVFETKADALEAAEKHKQSKKAFWGSSIVPPFSYETREIQVGVLYE